ncbi:hypothetical protein [Dysgonomonas termitidis]|uniref:Uncharacterized protein n=1 Tax=Dysgonomonas termitidis TaxID=1516126 RepID=A0ABV9L3P9_9BACT
MRKVYFSKDKAKIVFAVKLSGGVKNVTFSNFGGSYATSCKEEQKAIEDSFYFKRGLVYTASGTDGEQSEEEEESGSTEIGHVTNIQQAKELLRSSPYNIPYQQLGTPEKILRAAGELNISFPKLKL